MVRALIYSVVLLLAVGCGGTSQIGFGGVGARVVVTPQEASLAPGASLTLQAEVLETAQGVTWTATRGTISSAGVFTAPSVLGDVRITATSVSDPSLSDSATIHVVQPTISVTPSALSIGVGQQKTFVAKVVGYQDTSVSWTATGGKITADGVFTAGKVPGAFAVTVTSTANPELSATAAVTVTQVVAIAIDPTSTTLSPGGTTTFSATVTGTEDTSVVWTCTGGSVDGNGFYTAPATSGAYTVTATSNADPTKSATATVTVG